MFKVDRLELALDSRASSRTMHVALRLAGLEVVDSQRRDLPIAARDLMHDANSLVVQALAHEVLGRLENGEQEKASAEHQQRQTTHSDQEIPPAQVVGPQALVGGLGAREVPQQRPRDQVRDDLGDGPVDGQDGEEVLVGPGQELEEDGRVDGEVAADAEGPEGREDADGGEGGGGGGDEAPQGSQAERQVEGPAAPEDVAPEAPEHGAGEEPDVLRERQEGPLGRLELVRHGREDQRCHDRPEVV